MLYLHSLGPPPVDHRWSWRTPTNTNRVVRDRVLICYVSGRAIHRNLDGHEAYWKVGRFPIQSRIPFRWSELPLFIRQHTFDRVNIGDTWRHMSIYFRRCVSQLTSSPPPTVLPILLIGKFFQKTLCVANILSFIRECLPYPKPHPRGNLLKFK